MIENYINYLNFVEEKLNKFFESQKPFICCKKGCGKCCKNAIFPYSLMEMNYLLSGMMFLSEEVQDEIAQNVQRILKAREDFKGEEFRYDCPFLINDECSVYDYRGVVCRAFGLMTQGKNKEIKVPFCCFDGLNYSNVVDYETSKVSPEKFAELGCKEEPTAFNVSYEFLTNTEFEKEFNFKFGEKKPLIEWFIKN
ncbi:MAG: YkgJ family cysteine cluster protein [Candidatus Gastranaerophilales bacterium]|nr:YkgJ family cysteine cluster protein [Candidatus Gastranaerophilales bacterium]MCM1073191.1 YkgJ family cysteine cluster protein [Bacteroides sp.]